MSDWRTKGRARVAAKTQDGPDDNVLCPNCIKPMSRRKSARGEFWGCSDFPACRGSRKIGEETKFIPSAGAGYSPILKMPGSHEQEAIWSTLAYDSTNLIVNAGPGTGKTWTAVQWCLRAPSTQQITIVAFNKHIAKEANGKLAASKIFNAKARTYHSLGYGILREFYKNLGDPEEDKMQRIFEGICPMPLFGKAEWRVKLNLAGKLAGLVKSYLIDFAASNFHDEMEKLADHHDLATGKDFEEAVAMLPTALTKCIEMVATSIDFDDMVWLPIMLRLHSRYAPHLMITDEVQDLGTAEHELMFLAGAKRLMAIGDKRQAIYGWRGALTNSIDKLAERMGNTKIGVKEFPLTITRRCPKSHVQLAHALFPNCAVCGVEEKYHLEGITHEFTPTIQALPDAPEGEILSIPQSKAIDMMKADDLVICRVNAALIPAAYALIRRKIRPIIKGRDIGAGLRALIDKLEERAVERMQRDHINVRTAYSDELAMIREELGIYMREESEKLIKLEAKGEKRLAALKDKADCMLEFIANAKTVEQIRENLEAIFKDDRQENTVTLGTVHRTKGLEATRVFILAPELLPHSMAKKEWEREQERNLCWVACTRAMFTKDAPGTLVFCGAIPEIFSAPPQGEPVSNTSQEGVTEQAEQGSYFCGADYCDDPACMTHGDRKARLADESAEVSAEDWDKLGSDELLKWACEQQGTTVEAVLEEERKEAERHVMADFPDGRAAERAELEDDDEPPF